MSTSLSDSNGIRTHNHLVCKQTLNHLAKLAIDQFTISPMENKTNKSKFLFLR